MTEAAETKNPAPDATAQHDANGETRANSALFVSTLVAQLADRRKTGAEYHAALMEETGGDLSKLTGLEHMATLYVMMIDSFKRLTDAINVQLADPAKKAMEAGDKLTVERLTIAYTSVMLAAIPYSQEVFIALGAHSPDNGPEMTPPEMIVNNLVAAAEKDGVVIETGAPAGARLN